MTYVVTQNCCNDATCVDVCPVDCIHPAPGELGYATAELLHIDPARCIDCGACAEVCPVDAIVADDDLDASNRTYLDLNADYFQSTESIEPERKPPQRVVYTTWPQQLRVAIVGSGPSAFYAAEELLVRRDVAAEVTLFERLPFAGGLVRYGVAPDHIQTKSIERTFQRTLRRSGLEAFFNVEVGTHVTVDELLDHHHAVVFASGASDDRRLDIPGEDLQGSHSSREFVGWYNGHPDYAELTFDLSHPCAVIVGSGNVALDVARILTADLQRLQRTDIADHALDALAGSAVEKVIILGRRGPDAAACTVPELLGLDLDPTVDVMVGGHLPPRIGATTKERILADYSRRRRRPGARVIEFQFHTAPLGLLGDVRLTGIEVTRSDSDTTDVITCGLLLRSIGYRGSPSHGLPFDDTLGTIVNDAGRVTDPATRRRINGLYVTGWIKRGPSGVIGTNRHCANQTVQSLVADHHDGALAEPKANGDALRRLVFNRNPNSLNATGWSAIDRHERSEGRKQGRPRVKLTSIRGALDVVPGHDVNG